MLAGALLSMDCAIDEAVDEKVAPGGWLPELAICWEGLGVLHAEPVGLGVHNGVPSLD